MLGKRQPRLQVRGDDLAKGIKVGLLPARFYQVTVGACSGRQAQLPGAANQAPYILGGQHPSQSMLAFEQRRRQDQPLKVGHCFLFLALKRLNKPLLHCIRAEGET